MNSYPPPNYYQPQQMPPVTPAEELSGLGPTAKVIFVIFIPLLWVLALALPSYTNDTRGLACLAFGWSMLFTGNFLAFFAWVGNIPFWIGYFMFACSKRKKMHMPSLILGAIAFVLSFGALTVTEVEGLSWGGGKDYVDPEYGTYVWMLTSLLLLTGSIVSVTNKHVPDKTAQIPQNFPSPNYPPQYNQNPYPQNYPPQNYQQQNYPPQNPFQQQAPSNYQQQVPPNYPPQNPYQPPAPQNYAPQNDAPVNQNPYAPKTPTIPEPADQSKPEEEDPFALLNDKEDSTEKNPFENDDDVKDDGKGDSV